MQAGCWQSGAYHSLNHLVVCFSALTAGRVLVPAASDQVRTIGMAAEYWRLLLAESLMSSSSGSAWALALSYLAWCPQHGGDAADIMMEALPVSVLAAVACLLLVGEAACH
eukprot:scaffold54339_cov17-Tisochrysis_lutea.AAC.1